MSYYHEEIMLDSLVLCPVPQELISEAHEYSTRLQLTDKEMWIVLTRLPVTLKDSKVLFTAQNLGVSFEAASVLAIKCVGQWKATSKFDVSTIVADVSSDRYVQSGIDGVSKLIRARKIVQDLKWALRLDRFHKSEADILERLALAFLVCPERLVQSSSGKIEAAAFLEEALLDFAENGYDVVVLLMKHTVD